MSYGNGIKLTAGFDVGAKTPLDSKSVVQTIAERDAFVTDNLVYEGLEVYVKDTGHKYRYNGTSWIDLDTQSGSESGTGEGLTTEQANQLTTAYEHSQTPHVSADDIPTNISDLTNDSGFITSIPEEYITETELNAKGYLTSHQDISGLQPKTDNNLTTTSKEVVGAINEVKSSVDGITVPTKTSDLTNDSGFITSIPSEYITETELETKGYLTEHQSLTDYAKKTDIPDVSDFLTEVPAGYVTDTKLSTELDKKVNKEAGKGLSTNDLTNELITKINSSATEAFVTNAIANAQLGDKEVDLSGYATIDALELKADLTHTHDEYLTKVPDEYITETELNAKGYLTEHQDISNLQSKTDNSLTTTDKTVIGAINELKTNISNINTGGGSSFSGSYNDLTDKPTIPTKISDLNNDSGFIGHPDVIVINKGSMDAEVDLDNDIPLGRNTILLTGRVVYNTYGHELVFVYRDRESPNSFTIYTMKGDKVVASKSNGKWSITSNTSFIYRDNANSLYQKIKDNTLTTTAKTVPTAINELKSGLDGIKVPINISELNNDSGYLTSHQDISGLQAKTDNNLTTTSKEVVGAINEVKDMADLILDTEVRLDKTYSSSKICSDIQDAIDSSKSFTLAEIGKMSGASYKVVTSTDEMTDGKIIYLLKNGATYDMYIVETAGTATKIGDTAIDLSSYLKVTDAESAYLKKTEATTAYVAQTSFNNHIADTVAHLTQFEKNKLLTTDNITSTINNDSDNTQIPSAKATYDLANTKANTNHTHNTSDIKGLSIPTKVGELTNDVGYISEVINTLTSADTDKPLSANQGKILNDTKLNKTDANNLNCVAIDNVSLKEYILTNFTESEKTYYLIAKTTCTDLPKASNFYITVETPGMYTYKVTAKELNDSNGIYVCTYRTISSSWTEWEKVLSNGDIIDNLTSTNTNKPLSANQGKVLKDEVGLKANDSEVVKKTDITTTINSTSTDDTVPSASAIYNKSKNKINDFVSGRDIITYADGITNETVTDTVRIMNGTNSPYGTDNTHNDFHYTIYNIMDDNYKRIVAYDVRENDMYMIMKKEGAWGKWQRVCTTTVEDVSETFLAVNSWASGSVYYTVKNGICYVIVEDLNSATMSTPNQTIVSGLPKPMHNGNTWHSISANHADCGSMLICINDGNLTNYIGSDNVPYYGTFSYPVAEP